MKAIICTKLGRPEDALLLADRPAPPLIPGCVRIRLKAAGVNFADSLLIAGQYQDKPGLPFIPGMEAAGVVVEAASDVASLKPGDRVLAALQGGAFAEEAVAPVLDVARIPDAMDFATAAAFPVAYGTSHLGLKHIARLKEGETLVVHGAAGGVGLTAVECAKALGATVIATAGGADKVQVALGHGADFGIDYKSEDIRERVKALTAGKGADAVYDPVGGEVFNASLRALRPGGRILVVGFASGQVPQVPANLILVKNIAVLGYYWGAWRQLDAPLFRASLEEALVWWEEGKLKPLVSRLLPLDKAAEAIGLLTSRQATGKVVLEM